MVHEFSEAAKVSVSVKQSYQYFLSPVSKKYDINADMFDRSLEDFNSDLNKVMEVCENHKHFEKTTPNNSRFSLLNFSVPEVLHKFNSNVGSKGAFEML